MRSTSIAAALAVAAITPAPMRAQAPVTRTAQGGPKSRLAILPGLTHYTIVSDPALAAVVIPFLDEPAR